jgi:hypothetical protein
VTDGSLVDQVRALLSRVIDAHPGSAAASELDAARAALDEPLLVAIAGKVKAGKSTLLNALVGEELAPTDASECTKIVTWYQDGVTYRITLFPRDGTPEAVPYRRDDAALDVDLGARTAEDVERLVVEWPSASLRTMTLIDTPGLGSLSADVSARTERFFGRDAERPATADAVLYLMRHLHSEDVDFLEAFRDDTGVANPVNAVAVLSRADELSAGRLDGMEAAALVAGRYRRDPKVRRLCQTVVPVAGLVAQAGVTLTEDRFRAVLAIAEAPQADADALLLSVDRFLFADTTIDVAKEQRAALLASLGLFGVRLAAALVRDGTVHTATELAHELVRRSGIDELRDVLVSGLAARRDVLKARSGLRALQAALRDPALAADVDVAFDLERIVAGAHEFAEINLLDACRSGASPFRDDELAEVERLLGASGSSVRDRLGLDADAGAADVRETLRTVAGKWQTRAESPVSSREIVDAARVLVRTCEGLAATVTV